MEKKSTKELIESSESPEEIVSSITENTVTIERVRFDVNHWKNVFGSSDIEDDIDEYDIDMRKVKTAVTAIVRDGKKIEGGSPAQALYSQGSVYCVEVDGRKETFPFSEQAKFNVHVAWFAADNGDPTRFLKDY